MRYRNKIIGSNSPITTEIYDDNYYKYCIKKTLPLNAKMFIEDFCLSYSIVLSEDRHNRNFYRFDGEKERFEQLFGYDFLEYEFDEILSDITKNLLLFGKAYIIKTCIYDNKNELVKIKYNCLNCKKIKKRIHNLCCSGIDANGNSFKRKTDLKNIITFSLNDIGFKKGFFLRRIKKLKKLELPQIDLAKNKFFSIKDLSDKQEIYLLKLMRKIYWSGRNYTNQYINEPYLLFRIMMFKKLQNTFLEYIIHRINDDIKNNKKAIELTGKIVFESVTNNFDSLLMELNKGTKNCQEINNIIYKKSML